MASKIFKNIILTFDNNNNSKSEAFDGSNPAKRRLEENVVSTTNFIQHTKNDDFTVYTTLKVITHENF